MSNVIVLDKTDPSIAEAVAGCEVGKPQTFTITATPTADSDSTLVANIDSITYDESAEATQEEEGGVTVSAKKVTKPYKPRGGTASATDMVVE